MLHASSTNQVTPNFKPEKSPADRMAEDIVDLTAAEGCATEDRLKERGWTALDIDMYGTEAREIARGFVVRRLDRYTYNRPARIKEAARVIGHLVPTPQEISAALQSRSFTELELADILPEAIAAAADTFAHAGGAA